MKVLLTGATGYIGKRLLPILVGQGHEVICLVRDASRMRIHPDLQAKVSVHEGDLLKPNTLNFSQEIDACYYLVHSMSNSKDYVSLEKQSANNFIEALKPTQCQQIIYLSGIVNSNELSEHLNSRLQVEKILSSSSIPLTTLRAGIIIGSGSASFEIIRDLVEKLPIMVTPKWLNTKCQPIGIRDVLSFLIQSLHHTKVYKQSIDIGGPDVLSYKEMLLGYAKARGLNRRIFTLPVMTPRLSSYWLYFVTSTSYKLAVALVNSMKIEVVCESEEGMKNYDIQPLSYAEALKATLGKIDNQEVVSSWKDSFVSGVAQFKTADFLEVPSYGCFTDKRVATCEDPKASLEKIWRIGGDQGWYAFDFLWKIRGIFDKFIGGVGLRRGRTHVSHLEPGDALDFWRVLIADKEGGRLLLFAEMKLPGEAWLEFRLQGNRLTQTATFRPRGLAGRLYWYAVWPFHGFVFSGMLKALSIK